MAYIQKTVKKDSKKCIFNKVTHMTDRYVKQKQKSSKTPKEKETDSVIAQPQLG